MVKVKSMLLLCLMAVLLAGYALPGSAQGRTITLKAQNEPLTQVLRKIEKASDYKFMYSNDDLKQYRVTVSVSSSDIKTVVTSVIKGLPLKYSVQDKFVYIIPEKKLSQGPRHVTGTIYDEDGMPAVGASVLVPGTNIGAVTDNNGHFAIDLDGNYPKLQVSYIGMKTQIVNVRSNMKVQLEQDGNNLDDVIVTGLMDRDAKNFTGNATTYSGDELKTLGHQNIIKSLALLDPSIQLIENTAAGSNPNTMPQIRFRGESSFQGFESLDRSGLVNDPNQPLFILDGYETTLSRIVDLDMNRVQSVTILKDAAAAAIYGARAANGVIVVKTKQPKMGKLQVSYNLDVNAEFPDLGSYNLLDAKENLQLIDKLGLYRNDDGTYMPAYNQIATWVAEGVNTDWMYQPLRNSYSTRHSLNIQGGDERMRYTADLSYQGRPGVMKESKRDNYSLGVGLSYNLNDRVLFTNQLYAYRTNAKDSPYGSFSDYTKINSYFPIYDENGELYKYYYTTDNYGNRTNTWGNVSNIPVNPLYEASVGNMSKSKASEVNENFAFDWRITDHFRLNGRLSYTHTDTKNYSFLSPNSATYTDYGEGMSDITTEQQMRRGRYTFADTEQDSWDGNAYFSYSQQFAKHFVTASVGGSLSDNKSVVYGFTAQGFGASDIGEPAYANGYETGGTPNNVEGHSRLASFFASANYSYDNRYLVDFSYRLDGSSSFGNDERSAPFYSTGIGWNAHNEKFIQKLKFINLLRLRATYGEVGSVNFSPYQAKDMYSYTTSSRYDGNIGVLLQGLGNTHLKWQNTKTTELGLTVGLWNRVDITASWYNRNTKDMVLPVTTPPSMGFSSITENLGQMENKGYELNARVYVIKKPQFNVTLFGTASHNSNKIKAISSALESFNERGKDRSSYTSDAAYVQASHTFLTRYEEGQSTTAIYAVRSLGIDPMTGTEIFLTKDGHPTTTWSADDEVVVGDTQPDLTGTFGANVGWKGLYFNLTFQYQCGGQAYNSTLVDKVENSNKYQNVDKRVLTDTWQKPGDEAQYKANLTTRLVQYYTYASSRFVQDYDLLQLASLSVQYDLPKKWLSPLRLESVRLSFNTSDLGYWSTVKRERGTSYPYSRTFTFGLRVNF